MEPHSIESGSSVRERILDVALVHLAKHGERGTRLRTVAAEAGVSLGALQYYFPTKAVLARAVEERIIESFNQRQAPSFAVEDVDVATFLHIGLRAYLAFTRENPHIPALGARLAAERPEHQWPGEAETQDALLHRIRAAQEAGRLRDFEPIRLIVLMEAMLNGWISHRDHLARHLSKAPVEQLDDEFADFAVRVLLSGIRDPSDPESSRE